MSSKSNAPKATQTLRTALNGIFQEREQVIDGMMISLLARQGLYMLGPPGTGKSFLCRVMTSMLTGAKYFEKTLNKFSVPEELFGSISFSSMQTDIYERVVEGMLPDCHVAFLDEVPRAGASLLDATLPVINERKFKNGKALLNCPLETFFAAGNTIPDAEGLEAFWDRMVLRYVVQEIQSDDNMKALLKLQMGQLPSVTLDEIHAEQAAAMALPIPDAILNIYLQLRTEVKNAGLVISDRRWMQATAILKAQAYLNGHTQVESDDLEILEAVLWSNPEEMKQIRQLVSKFSNQLGEAIIAHTDAVHDILGRFRKKEEDLPAYEVQKKLKKSLDSLRALQKPGTANTKLEKAIAQVVVLNNKFVKEELGVE